MYDEMMFGFGASMMIFYFAFAAFTVIVQWRIFEKADKPGWGCLIPIYNTILMLEIVGRPGWWVILYFIPVVNVVVSIIVMFDLAASFGEGTGFGFGLLFLSLIFMAILAFGDYQYQGSRI